MNTKRVLVCGGRDFDNADMIDEVLREIQPGLVIHGAARGADSLAGEWAERNGVPVETFPADWRKYRQAAGPIRNKQMLDEGKPDLVVAFPGAHGTANMMRQATDAGVSVFEVSDEGDVRAVKRRKLPTVEDVVSLCSQGKRVCPMPTHWDRVYTMLVRRAAHLGVPPPPNPLILSGWGPSTDEHKRERLMLQLTWADENGVLPLCFDMLERMRETHWKHIGDGL